MNSYSIRLARFEELAQLREIEQSASSLFQHTKYAIEVAAEALPIEFLKARQQEDKVWVATNSSDEPVGFAVVMLVDGVPHLHELSVDPKHGRKGIGSRLIREVVAWAKDAGYKIMTLSTFRDIAWNAPFYKKLGFRELGEAELSHGLIEIRQKEAGGGLPVDERVFMMLAL